MSSTWAETPHEVPGYRRPHEGLELTTVDISETLVLNGTIRTMAHASLVESFLIRDARIVCVGTEQECRDEAITEPAVFDLNGATVLPGFVDAHCHPLMFGQFSSWIDCGWEAAPGIKDVVAALSRRAAGQPTGPIRGKGFHHGNVAERRSLTRHDLDRVADDREVLVFHSSGHGAIVNSWALKMAGVTAETPDPSGGHFGREADGTPNGEVWDAAADALTGTRGVKITNNGPNFHLPEDVESLIAHLAAAQHTLHAAGVTSVVDAQVTARELHTYLRLRERGALTMRVEMLIISSLLGEVEALGLGGRLGDDQLAFTGIKLYVDGALTAATARFEEPYCCTQEDFGYLYHAPGELAELLSRVDKLGLQTATHAQGDAAIQIVLDAHAAMQNADGPSDIRHRIEHFGAPTVDQIHQAAELKLWPVTQPQYIRRYGDELVRALGDRAQRITPLGEMRDAGLPLVLSSDAPVCPPHPMEAIYAAVTRRTLANDTLGTADQCLTVEQALRAHTLNAAASIHREHAVGSLEAGKFADFVVLSADPVIVPVDELLTITPTQTWVNGTPVFESSSPA